MENEIEILTTMVAAAFAWLALASIVQWRRHPDSSHAALAWALSLLATVAVVERISVLTDSTLGMLTTLSGPIFLASGYFLIEFRHTFLPLPRAVRISVAVLIGLIALGTIVYPVPESGPGLDPEEVPVALFAITAWGLCVIEPCIQMWLASRDRPLVQRSRLRSLSLGYATLVLLAIISVLARADTHPAVAVVTQIAALTAVPVLYSGFAPPARLRAAWARREEEAVELAEDLAIFLPDRPALAGRALDRALRIAGASAGFIATDKSQVFASQGLGHEEIDRLLKLGRQAASNLHDLGHGHYAIVARASKDESGEALLAVISGPFTPLFGTDEVARVGAYAAVVGVALDRVRLVEELQQQTSQYELLLQALSDVGEGFLVTDAGKLVYSNDAYCRMTGYTQAELEALPSLLELSVPEDREELTQRMMERLAGGAVSDHYESRLLTKDGRIVDCEAAVKLIRTPGGPRIISVVRDITERKRAEAFREEFVANAAHELRTPVAAIVGFTSLLKMRKELDEEKLGEVHAGLQRQADRLKEMVADLLDLTVIREGRLRLEREPVAVAGVLESVLETSPPPDGKQVEASVGDDAVVLADPIGLDQILTNLVTNAYRYGGTRIVVSSTIEDSVVTTSVTDDGTGVERDLVPLLFEPFARGRESRRVGGSGLGLAIVRTVVHACGGEIWYEFVYPHGSNFTFRLPRHVEPTAAPEPA